MVRRAGMLYLRLAQKIEYFVLVITINKWFVHKYIGRITTTKISIATGYIVVGYSETDSGSIIAGYI